MEDDMYENELTSLGKLVRERHTGDALDIDGNHGNAPALTLQYGYAYCKVTFDKRVGQYSVKARNEDGEGWNPRELPLGHVTTDVFGAADFCVDVLKTGRTVAVGKGVGLRDRHWWPYSNECHFRMDDILEMVNGKRGSRGTALKLDPDYQRDHVWTKKQATTFVGFLLEGGQAPLIYMQRYDSNKNVPAGADYCDMPIEVLDGQQRVRAIVAWMRNEIPAVLTDGTKIWFKDTDEVDRRGLPMMRIAFIDLNRKEQLRFYLALNRGGTVHTNKEIERVRTLLDAESN
jgi:hypothetical protein